MECGIELATYNDMIWSKIIYPQRSKYIYWYILHISQYFTPATDDRRLILNCCKAQWDLCITYLFHFTRNPNDSNCRTDNNAGIYMKNCTNIGMIGNWNGFPWIDDNHDLELGINCCLITIIGPLSFHGAYITISLNLKIIAHATKHSR